MTIKMRCISLTEVTLIAVLLKNKSRHYGYAQLINIRILGWWKLNSIVVTTVLQSIWKQKSSQQNHHLLSNFIFCPLENTTSGRSVSKTWEICMTLTVCAQNMIMTPFQYLKLHWTQSLFHFICTKEKNSNSQN